MFKTILVPLDGSTRAEQALPVAARIARNSGGSIVLLRVVTAPIDFAWSIMESPMMMQEAIDEDIAKAKEYLNTITALAVLDGIAVKTEVLPGDAALTILPVARSSHADLIVMCSHGETGLKLAGREAQSSKSNKSVATPIGKPGIPRDDRPTLALPFPLNEIRIGRAMQRGRKFLSALALSISKLPECGRRIGYQAVRMIAEG